VRGFTTLSEGYRDNPEALTTLMNRLLSPLSDAIIERGGTIDKYMGDGIMAFWNAPLDVPEHAKRAVEAALDMLDRLRAFDATLAEENRHTGRAHYPLRLGIGVNTGSCVVGNLGSNLRFDYSALGDAVNLTSRLEGQSKAYAVEIIVSQSTAAQLDDAFPLLELDLVRVKGRSLPERIYTVLGPPGMSADARCHALIDVLKDFHTAYRAQAWDRAEAALDAAVGPAEPFGLGGYLDVMRERIAEYRQAPPGPDWDGVHAATSK
jgi:adenylate cyclase